MNAIDIVTELQQATLRWMSLQKSETEEVKTAVWLRLKNAQKANDDLEEKHGEQMKLVRRRRSQTN